MQIENEHDDLKPDLKHDTMEFAASTDGDDQLTADVTNEEEDEISAEELDILDSDDEQTQSEALATVEADRQSDSDVYFEAGNEENEAGELEDDRDEHHRN